MVDAHRHKGTVLVVIVIVIIIGTRRSGLRSLFFQPLFVNDIPSCLVSPCLSLSCLVVPCRAWACLADLLYCAASTSTSIVYTPLPVGSVRDTHHRHHHHHRFWYLPLWTRPVPRA